jgi:hypothetical protein
MTENGSKWPKKWKRRSEVRESESLNENINGDRSTKKMDHGQLNKRKNPLTDVVRSSPKWERKRAQRRMTTGREIMGNKVCKMKAKTGKKHNTCA